MIQGRHSLIHEDLNAINIMNLGVTAPSHSVSFISPLDGLTFICFSMQFPLFSEPGWKKVVSLNSIIGPGSWVLRLRGMRVLKAPRTHLRGLKNSILFQNNGLDFCASLRRREDISFYGLWSVRREEKCQFLTMLLDRKHGGTGKKKIRPSERHSI